MEMTTAKAIATAARINPHTKKYVLRDEYGLAYEGHRYWHVLSAISRPDISPELSQKTRTVAYALLKSISSARMEPVSAARISAYTPYQLCALVARITRECPEDTTGGICDGWLPRHHNEL